MGRGNPKNSIKVHGDAKLGKWPRKFKESKWVRDAQRKTNGTQEPVSNVTQEPMVLLSH